MKAIYKLLIVTVMMFGASSCGEDFLNLQPQQSVPNDVYLSNIDDFRTAILGAHDQLQNSDWYGRYFLLVPDVMGEDIKQNASANRAKEWAEYNGTDVDFIPLEIWAELYEGINIVNSIINSDYAPPAAVQAEHDHIVGQAYAIRALAHFDLVRIFAQHYSYTAGGSHEGIPIVTTYDVAAKPARNTVDEVYTQVISDFQQAISMMSTDEPTNAGYMNKAAAEALLGRVYLYKEDWTNAEAMSTAAINTATGWGKGLVANADYPTMFLDGNSSEALFEINMILTDNNGSDHLGGMYKETGYGDYLPSQILIDLLDTANTGDIRGMNGMFMPDANLTGIYGSVRVNKYPSSGADIGTDNLPIIRLSEVYLNRAEARAHVSNDAGAAADANMIRGLRAPLLAPVAGTGQALIDEILLERRKELYAEGHRIFDISRNKQSMDRTADCTSVTCLEAYPNDRFILPIPADELSANTSMTQNPDY